MRNPVQTWSLNNLFVCFHFSQIGSIGDVRNIKISFSTLSQLLQNIYLKEKKCIIDNDRLLVLWLNYFKVLNIYGIISHNFCAYLLIKILI